MGFVVVERGYRVEEDPDTVRGRHFPFIATDRIPADGIGDVLSSNEILPGFRVPLSELFD